MIVDHQVIVHSSNNGYQEVSTIAGGSNFASESDLNQAYNSLQSAAAEYTDPKTDQSSAFSAEIEKRYNSHIREIQKFQATHNTLQATVRASAQGNEFFDKKRGWQIIDVIARVRCLGEPNPAKLTAQIAKDMNLPIGGDLHFKNDCAYIVQMVERYKTLRGL